MDPENKTVKAIQNITQNLSKLNEHSKSNWSYKDLNKKLLSAPSNFTRNYDNTVTKNYNENMLIAQTAPEQRFDIISGSPQRPDQRLARLRQRYGFINRNSAELVKLPDADAAKTAKIKAKNAPKLLQSLTSVSINDKSIEIHQSRSLVLHFRQW